MLFLPHWTKIALSTLLGHEISFGLLAVVQRDTRAFTSTKLLTLTRGTTTTCAGIQRKRTPTFDGAMTERSEACDAPKSPSQVTGKERGTITSSVLTGILLTTSRGLILADFKTRNAFNGLKPRTPAFGVTTFYVIVHGPLMIALARRLLLPFAQSQNMTQ